MKKTYIIPALLVLGLTAFAQSALALSTHLESETVVTVQKPVNDNDMIYVGPGGVHTSSRLEASATLGQKPLTVSFTGLGLDAGSTYIIDFGDGSNSGPLTSPGRCPQMTYPQSLRSEEHTSELQSQSNLVCRLLL